MSYTLKEITKQANDWEITLNLISKDSEIWKKRLENYDNLYFTGCGTSYYIAISAAYYSQEVTGKRSHAIPASEIMLIPEGVVHKEGKNLLVGVSRSGETTETVEALRRFREDGYGDSLSISCKSNSSTSKVSNYAIELPHSDEKSVVMTGTFTNMLISTQILTALMSPDSKYFAELKKLPSDGRVVIEKSRELAFKLGHDKTIQQFIYLGLGAYYGIASEAVLKLKEMTQVPTEAYSTLEFRHGPISIVNENTMTILLESIKNNQYQLEVLKDVKKLGSKTTLVTSQVGDKNSVDEVLNLPEGYSDMSRGVLYLPFVQLVGYYRAISLGLDPDKPRNLTQVVTL